MKNSSIHAAQALIKRPKVKNARSRLAKWQQLLQQQLQRSIRYFVILKDTFTLADPETNVKEQSCERTNDVIGQHNDNKVYF